MHKDNPTFLSHRFYTKAATLLYDYLSFVLFLGFIAACFIVGKPLRYIDKKLRTKMAARLIRLFEFFAQ